MQGVRRKAYQPGPNLKAGFTEYKAQHFTAETDVQGIKQGKLGKVRALGSFTYICRHVILFSHLFLGLSSFVPKKLLPRSSLNRKFRE